MLLDPDVEVSVVHQGKSTDSVSQPQLAWSDRPDATPVTRSTAPRAVHEDDESYCVPAEPSSFDQWPLA